MVQIRNAMRSFNYRAIPDGLLTNETMNLLAAVHEAKGRQELNLSVKPDVIDALAAVAKVQSTESSNRIEGIRTSSRRIREIVAAETRPKSRDEEEIAGYRDVLKLIHEDYDSIEVTPGVLLQLHRDLYRHTPSSLGGHFKIGDNEIRGIAEDGTEYVRFRPLPAVSTPQAVEELCSALTYAIDAETIDPLLASLLFVFDFTCVHPFNDGNGRMSRLLTLLLMFKAGYYVGKYISIEKEIERTKDAYYDALAKSSEGWNENANDPGPFVCYMLGVILASYHDFESRLSLVSRVGASKPERIEAYLRDHLGTVRKSEIAQALPDISETTIERTLATLLKTGKIEKVGAGRATAYVWKTRR